QAAKRPHGLDQAQVLRRVHPLRQPRPRLGRLVRVTRACFGRALLPGGETPFGVRERFLLTPKGVSPPDSAYELKSGRGGQCARLSRASPATGEKGSRLEPLQQWENGRMNERPTRILVDLDAIAHNLGAIRERVRVPVMGIVKANAYGHGLVPVARRL